MSYPIGLHAKTNYFRCDAVIFNNRVKNFILSRMQESSQNIKPVFVVNADRSVDMYEANPVLNNLTFKMPMGNEVNWKMQVENQADYMLRRIAIQKDNTLTQQEKEDQIDNL